MNRAIIIGNLTKDPELRKTQSDVSVCTFAVAVSRTYADKDGKREADFLPVVTWRGTADNCYRYLKKGRRVAVCGSIQTRSYEDKDGIRRYVTEIIADEVQFLSPAEGGNGGTDQYDGMEPVDDEMLPF